MQRPVHSGKVEALLDDALAPALHDAGSDEPSVEGVLVVPHPVVVVAEVLQLPVDLCAIVAEQKTGIINTPLSVENNRAYVSGAHRRGLKVGQKVGDGEITYVGNQLDLDTGMYIVKTKNVDDGVVFAETECSGFFIPTYAVRESQIMRAESGSAIAVPVSVNASDSEFSCVSGDIHDGDGIVLSKVGAGQKINVQK